MQSTGMVRKLDALGRIVIPMELHKILDIVDKDMCFIPFLVLSCDA